MSEDTRLQSLLATIDDCNRQDPNLENTEQPLPKALLYGWRMSETLAEFAPDADEALQIAARAQHIERWRIPRSDYPPGRAGYLHWRRDLGQYHAQRTGELMQVAGYDTNLQQSVSKLLTKQGIKHDPQAQTLEDVICIVFVKHYLTDFASNQEPEKLKTIIRKTWAKMSPQGQSKILTLPLHQVLKTVLNDALTD